MSALSPKLSPTGTVTGLSLRRWLVRLGNTVGGFGEVFLIYVVAGGAAAIPFGNSLYSDSPVFNAVHYVLVYLPMIFLAQVGWWLHSATVAVGFAPPWADLFFSVDPVTFAVGPFVAPLLGLIGFLSWHRRSRLTAWLLGVGFVALSWMIGSTISVFPWDTPGLH